VGDKQGEAMSIRDSDDIPVPTRVSRECSDRRGDWDYGDDIDGEVTVTDCLRELAKRIDRLEAKR